VSLLLKLRSDNLNNNYPLTEGLAMLTYPYTAGLYRPLAWLTINPPCFVDARARPRAPHTLQTVPNIHKNYSSCHCILGLAGPTRLYTMHRHAHRT
jgi:hypothetical protein